MKPAARAVPSVLLAAAGLLVVVGAALAQSEVALRVRTVLATDSGSEMDARLSAQQGQLQRLFRYSSYRLMKEERRRVPWGSPNNFEIPGGRYLQVLPIGVKGGRLRLKVVLIEGASSPPLDADFSLPNHGNLWVAGPKHPDGVLLICIGAEADQ